MKLSADKLSAKWMPVRIVSFKEEKEIVSN